MSYEKQQWNDGDTNTPLSGARLTHIENGIHAAMDAATRALETSTVDTVPQQVHATARFNRLMDKTGYKTRAVGIGWEDTSNQRDWATIATTLVGKGYNTVDLAVGRPEWTLFPWPEHPERVSINRNSNPIRDIITTMRGNGIEQVYLTIDTMVTTTLTTSPQWKAVSRDGTVRNLPSAAALTGGPVRDMMLGAVNQVTKLYGDVVDGVVLTELFWDSGSFSDNDLELYKRDTGASDWPRRRDGTPHESPEYREWLTDKMADFVRACRNNTNGVPLIMDVRVNWENPTQGRKDAGHDYAKLLSVCDEIQAWAYYKTGSEDKPQTLANVLAAQWPGRVRVSLGLWDATPESVSQALPKLENTPRVQVTPYSRMGSLLE